MTIRTLFAIPIAIILVVTLSLAGMMAGRGWSDLARGRAAVEAVVRVRLLLDLQTDLRDERVVTNFSLGQQWPLSDPVRARLDAARSETNRALAAVTKRLANIDGGWTRDEPYIAAVAVAQEGVRASIDDMLARGQSGRSFDQLNAIMPTMLAVASALDPPLERASIAVISTDPTLSGLVTLERLSVSLRDQVGLIAEIVLPRFNSGQTPSQKELEDVRVLLARAGYLTKLIGGSTDFAGSTAGIRAAVSALEAIDLDVISNRLGEPIAPPVGDVPPDIRPLLAQSQLTPWGQRINTLRTALMDATAVRANENLAAGEWRFNVVLTGFGAVMFAVLEAIALLLQRVVAPLSRLGDAITRIAAGDRGVPVRFSSDTREIREMETAVETLRLTALVADATATRQRQLVQHRLGMLREALGIVRAVREPARALERGAASLLDGIDAAIALVNAERATPPVTLGAAAAAVRTGLAEMRGAAASLDAAFDTAGTDATDDWLADEFVACIRAVEQAVDSRDLSVRRFIQPSLVALRDAAEAVSAQTVRDLVSDQFHRIETTVATMASVRAAVSRAASILRDLSAEEAAIIA